MSDPQRIQQAITNITTWTKSRLLQVAPPAWSSETRFFLNAFARGGNPTPSLGLTGFFARVWAFQTSTEQPEVSLSAPSQSDATLGAAVANNIGLIPTNPTVETLASQGTNFLEARLNALAPSSWTADVLDWAAPTETPEIPRDNAPPIIVGFLSESILGNSPDADGTLGQFLINA